MNERLAILCPGQGTQHAAMFDLAIQAESAAALLDGWNLPARLGMPDRSLQAILSDPALLFANQFAQPLLVAAGLAAWAAVRNDLPQPALVAGYSVGEVTAHAIAGAMSPQDAIDVARQRAGTMDACVHSDAPHVLVALSGNDTAAVASVLADSPFSLAIDTPAAAIAGGLRSDLPALESRCARAGVSIALLPVGIASHTPLMAAAVGPLRALFGKSLSTPAVPVIAGISAEYVFDSKGAIDTLARQACETIRWTACLDSLKEAGITVALELGPGCTLSRMLHARHPAIETRSVGNFRTLRGVRDWLQRRLG